MIIRLDLEDQERHLKPDQVTFRFTIDAGISIWFHSTSKHDLCYLDWKNFVYLYLV